MKVIFLDRDGVINVEKNYLHQIDDFEFIDGVFEACRYLESLGYKIIIITNQSGIGRGYYGEDDFQLLTQWMLKEFQRNGISILDVYHCPHAPEDLCDCRKPKPGMILEAANRYPVNLVNSWLIGDKESDIESANRAGIQHTILVKSGHKINAEKSNATYILGSIKEAIDIIKA